MTQHTTGTWEVEKPCKGATAHDDGHLWVTVDGRMIAVVGQQAGEEIANARLIAAAPALLEACQGIYHWCAGAERTGPAWDQLRAALQLAEGVGTGRDIRRSKVFKPAKKERGRPKRVWTYELAMAAAKDAANAQMRKAGRKAWSEDDYNLACKTLERLYGAAKWHALIEEEK